MSYVYFGEDGGNYIAVGPSDSGEISIELLPSDDHRRQPFLRLGSGDRLKLALMLLEGIETKGEK